MLGCALGAEQAAHQTTMGSVTSHGGILRTVGLLRSEQVPSPPNQIRRSWIGSPTTVKSANEGQAPRFLSLLLRADRHCRMESLMTPQGQNDVFGPVMGWRLEVLILHGVAVQLTGGCLFSTRLA